MKIAECPYDKTHDKFITTAHIMQEWVVDKEGNYLEVADECIEVTHYPTHDNVWSCAVCGARAKTIEVDN